MASLIFVIVLPACLVAAVVGLVAWKWGALAGAAAVVVTTALDIAALWIVGKHLWNPDGSQCEYDCEVGLIFVVALWWHFVAGIGAAAAALLGRLIRRRTTST